MGLRFPCSRDVWAVVRWVRYSDCPEAAQLGGDWIDRFGVGYSEWFLMDDFNESPVKDWPVVRGEKVSPAVLEKSDPRKYWVCFSAWCAAKGLRRIV